MLDENLPAFFYKRSPDGLQHNTAIFLSQHGSDPEPAYSLHRADPSAAHAKNCYAAAILDSYNPEILYAEVLIKPEWTLPSLSAEEIRRNNGVPPPPLPILPTEFIIQLYNPDYQVTVTQRPGTWGGSASYEFGIPQTAFRTPSASDLDRTQHDPAASINTPQINFVWRKESKLAKDLTCYMTGKSTDTIVKKKHRDPDIAVALYRSLRELTIYEPNLYRVELEDPKGLEVVLLLGAAIIKDLYFTGNVIQIFKVSNPPTSLAAAGRKTSSASPHMIGTGPGLVPTTQPNALAAKRKSLPKLQTTPTSAAPPRIPPLVDARKQWEIDAETARLRAQVEAEDRDRKQQEAVRRRERIKADEAETQRLRRMVEAEQREAQRRHDEVERETERLRKQYGVDSAGANHRRPAPSPGTMPASGHTQRTRPNQSQSSRPGPAPLPASSKPVRGPNGLYMQANPSTYASSSAVMSGALQPSSPEAKKMKKKSFFGLRSHSDDSERKLQKKTSAMS